MPTTIIFIILSNNQIAPKTIWAYNLSHPIHFLDYTQYLYPIMYIIYNLIIIDTLILIERYNYPKTIIKIIHSVLK